MSDWYYVTISVPMDEEMPKQICDEFRERGYKVRTVRGIGRQGNDRPPFMLVIVDWDSWDASRMLAEEVEEYIEEENLGKKFMSIKAYNELNTVTYSREWS